MSQNLVYDVLVLNATVRRPDNDLCRPTAAGADMDVHIEYPFEPLSPGHTR